MLDGDEIAVLDVPTMREYFERGGADETGERVALAETRLRAPIVPKKFFHTAGNFREHEEESKQVGWSHEIAPWIVFFQNVDAIVGPDEPVVYPEHLTEELDYELELAVVLRKPGKWFSPEEAVDYIGGYVIFNDITARDIQRREMRSGVFSFCKAIDTFCPLGPWIVTPDEIPDPHDLAMELRVNGESRQVSHSGRMSVTIPEILSHYSALGYSAGDVLSTGTVSGVAGFSPDAASLYLKPGDVMEARSSASASSGTRSSRGRRRTASPRLRGCGGSRRGRAPSRARRGRPSLRVLRGVSRRSLGGVEPVRGALPVPLRRDCLASAAHELRRAHRRNDDPRRHGCRPSWPVGLDGRGRRAPARVARRARRPSGRHRRGPCRPTSTSITSAGTRISRAYRSSRARYVVHSDALAFALSTSGRAHIQRCVVPLVERFGVGDELELAPGVTAFPTPGHYPGHLSVRIASAGAGATILGDVAPHPALLDRTEWRFEFDEDADRNAAVRSSLVDELAGGDGLVVCGHYPGTGIGRLAQEDGRVVWTETSS